MLPQREPPRSCRPVNRWLCVVPQWEPPRSRRPALDKTPSLVPHPAFLVSTVGPPDAELVMALWVSCSTVRWADIRAGLAWAPGRVGHPGVWGTGQRGPACVACCPAGLTQPAQELCTGHGGATVTPRRSAQRATACLAQSPPGITSRSEDFKFSLEASPSPGSCFPAPFLE